VCPRKTPNMANCIMNSIESMRHILATGDFGPGYEAIPRLEPFYLPSIQVGDRNDFRANFTDIYVKGGSKFIIEKLKTNMRELKFDALVKLPRMDIKSKYDLNFNLFGFRLKGQGDSHTIIDNSRGRLSIRAKKYIHEGEEYLNFEKFHIKIQIGHIRKATLSNIFGGQLGASSIFQEILNTLLRSQPEFVFSEIYPPIENDLSEIFTSIANRIAKTATYNEIFPV